MFKAWWRKWIFPGPDEEKAALWLGVPPSGSGYSTIVTNWKVIWALFGTLTLIAIIYTLVFLTKKMWLYTGIGLSALVALSWVTYHGNRVLNYTLDNRFQYREVWKRHYPSVPPDKIK